MDTINSDLNKLSTAVTESQKLVRCYKCGKKHKKDDLWEVNAANGTVLLCTECRHIYCDRCSECGKYFLSEESTLHAVAGHLLVCDRCVRESDRYFKCDSCHNWYHDDDYGEDGICRFCLEEADGNDEDEYDDEYYDSDDENWGGIHDYHGFSCIRFYHSAQHCDIIGRPLYLGFELEAGGIERLSELRDIAISIVGEYSQNQEFFHLERDASISSGGGKYGFELISMPMTLDFHKSFLWADVLREMDSSGMLGHDLGKNCCGLHVHFSKNFLTCMEMVKLDYFVALHRKNFELIARRGENDWLCYKGDNAGMKSFGKGCCHYDAVNFSNRDTVEIRIFRSSLRYETLMATLEIVDSLARFIKLLKSSDLIRDKHGSWKLFSAFLSANKARYSNALEYLAERKVAI